LEAQVEIRRRHWGVAVAILFCAIWVAGNWHAPSHFPVAPNDRDLFGAIPLVGIGAMVAAICAPIAAKRSMKGSEKAQTRRTLEHHLGEHYERLFGVVLAAVYVGVWLNPW
jgi:hypothetical protein